MRILVTDGDARSALAAVRSLGRGGHEVITAAIKPKSLAGASRHSSAAEIYPDPMRDPDGFVAAVVDIVRRRGIEVLLPMTEVTTLLITQNRHLLPAACKLPFAPTATIARASNKAEVITLAREIGVPVPRTIIVGSANEALAHEAALTWPVVVKPARSRVRAGSQWVSTSVAYAADAAALRRMLGAMPVSTFPVLLQERIEGPGVGIFVCMESGEPVALFSHRRLREKPPSGGVSVLSESAPLDPAARENAVRLLRAIGWHGVAMVEFKRDSRDGSLRLMEINGRFWGSLQLSIKSGVDFPAILVGIASGAPPKPVPDYRLGVRSRWLSGDLDSLLLVLRRSRRRLDLNSTHAGRLRTLWNFLHFTGRDLHYELEQTDDLGPARLEWKRWLLGS
jgi:predicted ATP-grasp superfamily ATP-dependent carboligase